MRRFRNIIVFYRSLLPLNLAVSAAAAVFGGMGNFAASFFVFGFAFCLLLKEIRSKQEYIFYRNNGLSRLQLWLASYVLNLGFGLFSIALFLLCRRIF